MAAPLVIILAHRRAASLQRLLDSLAAQAMVPAGTPLLCLLDAPTRGVQAVWEAFAWPHGPKQTQRTEVAAGIAGQHYTALKALAKHCHGGLVLEDDLSLSPCALQATSALLARMEEDAKQPGQPSWAMAGLYSYRLTEHSYTAFYPEMPEGAYALQVPCSWAGVYTAEQAKAWLQQAQSVNTSPLPVYAQAWPPTSWKKRFMAMMIAQGQHCLYPAEAYATNHGEQGVHMPQGLSLFQVPLAMQPFVAPIAASHKLPRYDAWFEPDPIQVFLPPHPLAALAQQGSLSLDTYGQKARQNISTPWVLTSQPVAQAQQSWGQALLPPIRNVQLQQPGQGLALAERKQLPRRPPRHNLGRKAAAWRLVQGLPASLAALSGIPFTLRSWWHRLGAAMRR